MEKYSQYRDRGILPLRSQAISKSQFIADGGARLQWRGIRADSHLGSGIAPFIPVPTQPSGLYLAFHIFLFFFRLPILLSVTLTHFLVLRWLPIGSLGKKASLWLILGTPGIWWIDLQIDGVRRG